jgi:hypothetical protein
MRKFLIVLAVLVGVLGLTACSQGLTEDEIRIMVEEKLASAIAHGPQGPIGPQGEAGSQGEMGLRGEKGSQAETGPQGTAGLVGLQGERGSQGETGPQGTAGPQGEAGLRGESGPQGETGWIGATGSPGPAGPAGEADLSLKYKRKIAYLESTLKSANERIEDLESCMLQETSHYHRLSSSSFTHSHYFSTWHAPYLSTNDASVRLFDAC